MSGTVNISRSIWTDAAFKREPFTEREAFVWIIMEASYRPREKRIGNITVSLERGQLGTSVRFMAEAWGWSKSRADRFIKRLEKRDMIGTDNGTGINVITVNKYNDYQNVPKDSGTPKNKNRDSSGTAVGQQRDKPNTGLIQEGIQITHAYACDADGVCVTADNIWENGCGYLLSTGLSDRSAKALVGKLIKDHGKEKAALGIESARAAGTADPAPYITSTITGTDAVSESFKRIMRNAQQ